MTSASTLLVRVPASTSNLGSGFDCVGMAVARSLEVRVSRSGEQIAPRIARSGTLGTLECAEDDDLIWRGIVATSVALRRPSPAGLHLDAVSDIPVARGLGSSAAAVVAGVHIANALLDGNLDTAAMIEIAAALEGHPDNVAPAILGGAVLSVRTSGHQYRSVPLTVHPSLRFVFVVPDFEVRTSVARSVLPASVSFENAVTASSRAAALVAGLQSADAAILSVALDDVLHVPARRALIRGYEHVTNAAITAGAIGATLSGSGSSIVAVTTEHAANAVRDAALAAWRIAGVGADAFITSAEHRGAYIQHASATPQPAAQHTLHHTRV